MHGGPPVSGPLPDVPCPLPGGASPGVPALPLSAVQRLSAALLRDLVTSHVHAARGHVPRPSGLALLHVPFL